MYMLGYEDDGKATGMSPSDLSASIKTLRVMMEAVGAKIANMQANQGAWRGEKCWLEWRCLIRKLQNYPPHGVLCCFVGRSQCHRYWVRACTESPWTEAGQRRCRQRAQPWSHLLLCGGLGVCLARTPVFFCCSYFRCSFVRCAWSGRLFVSGGIEVFLPDRLKVLLYCVLNSCGSADVLGDALFLLPFLDKT